MALVAAVAIGLSSSFCPRACVGDDHLAMTDAIHAAAVASDGDRSLRFTLGLHVIEAIAEGIANAVEMIATPAPIAIPAPQTNT